MMWVRWGSVLMGLGVICGAFGGHALKTRLSAEMHQIYQVGVWYHLIHGLALLAVGWLATLKPAEVLVRLAGWSFVLGVILFSGSLYLLSLTGIKKFGMVTPLGGLAFLAGWACLAAAAR